MKQILTTLFYLYKAETLVKSLENNAKTLNAKTISTFRQVLAFLAFSAGFGILTFRQFRHYVGNFDFWHWAK